MAVLTVKSHREKNTFNLPRGEKIRRELRAWFKRQRRAVLYWLQTGHVRTKDETAGDLPDDFPDWDAMGLGDEAMADRMTPLLTSIWDEAGQKFTAKLGLDPDRWEVTNPNTQQVIDDAALSFCESTNETTSLELSTVLEKTREALSTGLISKGESLADLTRRINEIFDGAETWRARSIAATEASRAVHAAQEMSAIQSDVVTGWRLLLSADACPRCQVIYRKAPAVRLGQPFAVIGDHPKYSVIKLPPLHVMCQCSLEEVLDIDKQPKWAAPLVDPVPEPQDYPEDEQPAPKRPKPQAIKPKPAKKTLLKQAEEQAGVKFVPNATAQEHPGYSTVVVDVAKADASLQKDPEKYVGPGGTGAGVSDRYEQFRRFLADAREDGKPIEQPRGGLDADGEITLPDGRHRFAVLRDEGQELLPLSVPKVDAAEIRKRYGP